MCSIFSNDSHPNQRRMWLAPRVEILDQEEDPHAVVHDSQRVYKLQNESAELVKLVAHAGINGCYVQDSALLSKCLEIGILSREKPVNNYDGNDTPVLASLNHTTWRLTDRCNLKCRHCYVEASPRAAKHSKQSREVILSALLKLPSLQRVTISGGEPLLLEDELPLLVDKMTGAGKAVLLISNATTLSLKLAADLKDAGLNQLQVSIDGDETTHDAIRGAGNWRRALKGYHIAADTGLNVQVCSTFVPSVHKNEEPFVKLLSNITHPNLSNYYLGPLRPLGRGHSLQSSPKDFIQAHTDLRPHIDKHFGTEKREDPFSTPPRLGLRSCGAGISTIAISPHGHLSHCSALSNHVESAQSLLTHPLEEIMEHDQALSDFREITVCDIPECRSCTKRFSCGGGCRANAYAWYGSFRRHDPTIENCTLAEPPLSEGQ